MSDDVTKKVLLNVEIQNTVAIKAIADLKAQIESLKTEQKGLDKSTDEGKQKFEVLGQQIKALNTESLAYQKQIQSNVKSQNEQSGSIQGLKAQLSLQTAEYNKLSEAERNAAKGQEMQKSIKGTSDALKKLEGDLGDNHRKVGEYENAVGRLPGVFGEMQDKGQAVLVALRTRFESVKDATMMYSESLAASKAAQEEAALTAQIAAIKEQELAAAQVEGTATATMQAEAEAARATATEAATIATNTSTGSLKLLKIALIGTGIGAILVLLGSLVAWFKQTHEGTETLEKITNVLGATFKTLTGYLAKAVQGVVDFFAGIKSFPDLLSKVGDAIKENLINRLESFSVIGKAIGKILSGDIKEGFKDLVNGVSQNLTGVTNLVDKFGNVVSQVGKDVKDAALDAAKITEMEQALDKFKSKSIETIATLEKKKDEYTLLLGKAGQAATTKEREDAMNNLIKTEDALMAIKLKVARDTTAIKKAQLDLENKQSGDAQLETITAYRQAKADEIKLQGEYEILNKNVAVKRAKLYLQLLQEEVTSEQTTYDQNKAILQAKMNDEKLSTDQKLALLEKIKAESDENNKAQESSFQDYVNGTTQGVKKIIDFNELMKISDGSVLSQRMQDIGLSKLAQAELLKIINARKTETLALAQEDKKLFIEQTNQLIDHAKNELAILRSKDAEIAAGSKLSSQRQFEEDTFRIELDRKLAKDEAKLKLADGTLSQKKYNDTILLIDQQFRTATAQNEEAFRKRETDAKLTDLDNQLAAVQNNIDLEYQLKHDQLELQRKEEIRLAEEKGTSIQLINEKYAKLEGDLFADTSAKKFEAVKQWAEQSSAIMNAANNFEKEIEAGKLQDAEESNTIKTKELDDRLAKGLITQKQHDEGVAKSAAELDKKKAQIAHDQAVREKALNIMSIIINTAAAIMAQLKVGAAGIPLAIAAGITGAIELATVIATPVPKASRGLLLKGRSHAQGGIPIEAEGGEAIINKRSTSMFAPILSAMNEAGGGVAFSNYRINDGGYAARSSQNYGGVTKQDIEDAMTKAVAKVNVNLSFQDFKKEEANYIKMADRANF